MTMAAAKKLCLLGDFAVGKTSLIRRYTRGEFSADYRATVGVQLHRCDGDIETDRGMVRLQQVIWDIEGSKFGRELVTKYILGSSGALIVGDATREDVIHSMASHADQFEKILPGRPMIFALNKTDLILPEKRPSGIELTKAFDGQVIHTSALTGEAVTDLFHAMCRRILEIGA